MIEMGILRAHISLDPCQCMLIRRTQIGQIQRRIGGLGLISTHISPNQQQCIAMVPKFHSHSVVQYFQGLDPIQVPLNPVFAQNIKGNNAAVIWPSPQNGSALLARVSSPHVVVPCTDVLSNLQASSSTCRYCTVSSSATSKVTQANNYTRPSIARMSVKDSAAQCSAQDQGDGFKHL